MNWADLRDIEPHIHVPVDAPCGAMPGATSYDRTASRYDAVVGHPLYNQLVWGAPVRAYAKACSSKAFYQGRAQSTNYIACSSTSHLRL